LEQVLISRISAYSAFLNDAKYIGLDVHQATISVAFLDSADKLLMEAIVETTSGSVCMGCAGTHA